ncbi:hypothetical protein CFL01nite_11640 [Corynebacterium flavescens]|uniref:FCS-type domain-containing protein n=1 Tax=Corynebacterium flavescens TaxID=28028 RepID=A0AB73B772_CORFL|nr:hypothetical protein CFL01nite_11640 [Corynebacterium flavescens]
MSICKKCGKEFNARAGAKFCSSTCRQAAYRQRKDPRPPARRAPLRDSAVKSWLDLDRSVRRVERVAQDDRFTKMIRSDPHFLRGDLQRSVNELQAVIAEIDRIQGA